MKKSRANLKFNSKKISFFILAVVFAIIAFIFTIKKYKTKKPLSVIKEITETEKIENWGEKVGFLYVLETKKDGKKIYDFFSDDEKYFSVFGDLQSVFVNKKNPKQDFYIHLDDKLVIYPEKTSINVGYNDNFKIMTKDGSHMGGIWIGEDKNIYKTTLHFDPNFSCDDASLKILNKKYKIDITHEECNKHKSKCCGSNAVCVKQKYNKKNKVLEQEKAELTKSEACGTPGCDYFTYKNIDKSYVQVGNRFHYEHEQNAVLEKKIDDKLKSLKLIADGTVIVFFKTKDLIVAQKFLDDLSEGKIFVLDHNLNLKTTFDVNLNNSGYKKYIDSFLVKKDKLFVLTEDRNIFLYDLKTLKLIKKFDNLAFFSFM